MEAACSFCGKSASEVKRLVQGPNVWICDGCVRVSYEIIESLGDEPPPTSPAPVPDPVMARIAAVQQRALSGDRSGAREDFTALWAEIGPDGDPLHRVTIGHYQADAQDDAEAELLWDQRALEAADALTDERAQQYHATLAVRGFYPSLHLNLAADYEKLGRVDEARRHLDQAEAALPDLPPGGYGDLIRSGIAELRQRLG